MSDFRKQLAASSILLCVLIPATGWAQAGSDVNCDGALNVLDVQWVLLGALGAPLPLNADANQDGIHDNCGDNPVVQDQNNNGQADLCESIPVVADVSCSGSPCANCPVAPSQCSGGASGFNIPGVYQAVSGCGSPFVLYRDEAAETSMQGALANVISLMNGNGVAGDGLASLGLIAASSTLMNRVGAEVSSIPAYLGYLGSFSVGNGKFVERAFRFGGSTGSPTADFTDGLSDSDFWEVQGVTGNFAATGKLTEKFGTVIPGIGKRLLMVSFYHSDKLSNGNAFPKGVRIALVDWTSVDGVGTDDIPKYRLMLLVTPTWSGGKGTFSPVLYDNGTTSNHAGGIAWFRGDDGGEYLYVPDTATGIRVFDLNKILRVTEVSNNESLGRLSGNLYSAYGYRYVIPEVARYRLCTSSCCARFSTLSLDRSTDPPTLVTGEYDADSDANRIVRWPLNSKTGLPLAQEQANGGAADIWVAQDAFMVGASKVQGAMTLGEHVFVSTTQTHTEGGIYAHGKCFHAGYLGGTVSSNVCPSYPEGLYFDGEGIWTCTEKPNNRYCVRMSRDLFSSF